MDNKEIVKHFHEVLVSENLMQELAGYIQALFENRRRAHCQLSNKA